ncbi:hypothetical protein KSZ_69100 [Dictyobacter formicarum]|uniref:Glycosyltransferase 2-like domain-containing protein n=1 Tax=Dictyobacter formicarum TaxID=2778368 RepID=A0ABQ3VRK3_9CHLR|nr:hypothetical protein KSZ_69100 [Dictyobacter formicarum]
MGCSVGIMAYNEEANIAHTLAAVQAQQQLSFRIDEIVVVASGCTDQTVPIVAALARDDARIHLYTQARREGKASAINLFLQHASSEILILLSADVIPESMAFEHLCATFKHPHIGMSGGRPVPINNKDTFMGHTVHLLWHLHDRLARQEPKLGEAIAFRNVLATIPHKSAVDEISIQALISHLGYHLQYQPACIVYNKGPLTVQEFIQQRKRIYAGHLQVRATQNYAASTMKICPIFRQLLACRDLSMRTPQRLLWTLGAILLESYARLQGYYDYRRHKDYHIWPMIDSTKNLHTNIETLQYTPQAKG